MVDFQFSARSEKLQSELQGFMDSHVYPAEITYGHQLEELEHVGRPYAQPAVMDELQREARHRGLWNLFLNHGSWGAGLTVTDYAPIAEIAGRSWLGNEAMNCSAPDTGNMELLSIFGTTEQQQRWLVPLLDAKIRSAFAMTEPEVASSDPTNLKATIERRGNRYVLNGHKWWTSGILDERCELVLFVGNTSHNGPAYRRQSIALVPRDAPGLKIIRDLTVFGYRDRLGHGEVVFEDVQVPLENLLAGEGEGFAMAQARLGPGRIHYGMRAVGIAERALELMCRRAAQRTPFGKPLSDQGVVQEWIARSRMDIEQTRLLLLNAAWRVDRNGIGDKSTRETVGLVKVAALEAAHRVVDRAIQLHGGAGVGPDTPLPRMYTSIRALQIADGPSEVHLRSVARRELKKYEALVNDASASARAG
jgi:acyl-CoA dehydrogenase